MSLQAILNEQSLDFLPKVKKLIKKSNDYQANQIRCYTLKIMMNSYIPIADMQIEQKMSFENLLLKLLKRKLKQDWKV